MIFFAFRFAAASPFSLFAVFFILILFFAAFHIFSLIRSLYIAHNKNVVVFPFDAAAC